MQGESDINGKQARAWKNSAGKDISGVRLRGAGKDALVSAIRDVFCRQVKALRADAKDDRYRSIVDMLMLRVNSDIVFAAFETADVLPFTDQIIYGIQDELWEWFNGKSGLTYAGYFEGVLAVIRKFLGNGSSQKHEAESATIQAVDGVSALGAEKPESTSGLESESGHEVSLGTVSVFQRLDQTITDGFQKLDQTLKTVFSSLVPEQAAVQTIQCVKVVQEVQAQQAAVQEKQNLPPAHAAEKSKGEDSAEKNARKYLDGSYIYSDYEDVFEDLQAAQAASAVAVVQYFCDVYDGVSTNVKLAVEQIQNELAEFMERVDDLASAVGVSLFDKIVNFFKQQAISYLLKPIKEMLWDYLWKLLPDWWTMFKKVFRGIWNGMKALGKALWKVFKFVGKLVWKTFKVVYKVAKAALSGVIKLIRILLGGIWKALSSILSLLWKALTAIFRFAGQAIAAIFRAFMKTKVGKFLGKIGRAIGNAVGKVAGAVGKAFKGIGKVIDKVKGAFKKGVDKLKNALKKGIKKVVKVIKDTIKKVAKKIFNMVKNTIKKLVSKIANKLGLKIGKKIASKGLMAALKMGAKKIMGFFKKWVGKIIKKIAGKLLQMAGINTVPGVGQIISVCMMLYTIVDTIYTFWQVYKFMKENPEAWDFMKDQVVQWAKKAFNFVDDMLKIGKVWFRKIFIDGPKKVAKAYSHAINFLLNPISAGKRHAKQLVYQAQLNKLRDAGIERMRSSPRKDWLDFVNKNYKKNLEQINALRAKADPLTQAIEKESDSWWPDNKKIAKWLDERQGYFLQMMKLSAQIGIFELSKEAQEQAERVIKGRIRRAEAHKKLLEKIAAHRKQISLEYRGKKLNLDELAKILAEHRATQEKFDADVRDFVKDTETRAMALMQRLDDFQTDDPGYDKSELDDEDEDED